MQLNPDGIILVPSTTRLKLSLTSSSKPGQNIRIFQWLGKNEYAAEMKITNLYVSHFTSGPDGDTLALREKDSKNSRSIGRNRKSFRVTKAVHLQQRCHYSRS